MVFRVPDKTSRVCVCVCQASRTSARPLTCPLDLVAPALMASGWLLLLVETDAIVSALPASTRIYALACRLLQLPVVIASALLRANLNGPVVRQSARPPARSLFVIHWCNNQARNVHALQRQYPAPLRLWPQHTSGGRPGNNNKCALI